VPVEVMPRIQRAEAARSDGDGDRLSSDSETGLEVAAARVAEIQRALAARRPGATITVGLAELTDGDTLESLPARAESARGR
jgi:hypothetical protein